jgi:hypothetical protein
MVVPPFERTRRDPSIWNLLASRVDERPERRTGFIMLSAEKL